MMNMHIHPPLFDDVNSIGQNCRDGDGEEVKVLGTICAKFTQKSLIPSKVLFNYVKLLRCTSFMLHEIAKNPPPHSASCPSVNLVSLSVGGRKNTTSTGCNG